MCVIRAYASMCHDERKHMEVKGEKKMKEKTEEDFSCESRGPKMSQEGEQLLFFTSFFLDVFFGRGGEEETPGHVLLSRFRRTTRVSEQPFLCYIL